jgi:hypothetical protein
MDRRHYPAGGASTGAGEPSHHGASGGWMDWLQIIAAITLALAIVCAAVIAIDIARGRRQKMGVMNLVWPLTALYGGPLALWVYLKIGRAPSREEARSVGEGQGPSSDHHQGRPFWQSVGIGALHCGSGCTLGDVCAEWFVFFVPITLLGHRLYGAWLIDYALAFAFGIAFQYFSIKPMRGLSPREGLKSALKADTLSLSAWQVGMYGWMAIVTFAIFDRELEKTDPVFWFMMQIAMLAGFVTAYPVNWWLLRRGIKERM